MKTWKALGSAAVGLVLGVAAPCAHASYLRVNGSCIASVNPGCTSDLQSAPGANQLNLDNTFTLADGDSYRITGTVFVDTFFSTTPPPGPPEPIQLFTLNPQFQIQYLGSTPSQADTITLLFSQDFRNIQTLPGSITTNFLTGFTAGMLGAGSTIQMVNTVGGTTFAALMSALADASCSGESHSFCLQDNDTLPTLTDPFTDSIAYTMFIGSGSEPGFIVEVPAPAALAVLGIGLIGLGAVRRRVR